MKHNSLTDRDCEERQSRMRSSMNSLKEWQSYSSSHWYVDRRNFRRSPLLACHLSLARSVYFARSTIFNEIRYHSQSIQYVVVWTLRSFGFLSLFTRAMHSKFNRIKKKIQLIAFYLRCSCKPFLKFSIKKIDSLLLFYEVMRTAYIGNKPSNRKKKQTNKQNKRLFDVNEDFLYHVPQCGFPGGFHQENPIHLSDVTDDNQGATMFSKLYWFSCIHSNFEFPSRVAD